MNLRGMPYDEIEKLPKYTLDDKLLFGCKACGKCCLNRHDILLTPYDIFNIAKYFNRKTEYVINRYCELYIGQDSKLPIARLNPVPPTSACPFLREKKCRIHLAKPIVCRVFPLGRLINAEGTQVEFVDAGVCPENPPLREFSVRDWIGHAASEEAEKAGVAFTKRAGAVATTLRSEEAKNLGKDELSYVYSTLTQAFYLNYDTSAGFLKQFNRNITAMCKKLSVLFPIGNWD